MRDPKGTRFYDLQSGREMLLVLEGPFNGWIAYRHPDGQWVTLRKATDDDLVRINEAAVRAHHSEQPNNRMNLRKSPRSAPSATPPEVGS